MKSLFGIGYYGFLTVDTIEFVWELLCWLEILLSRLGTGASKHNEPSVGIVLLAEAV